MLHFPLCQEKVTGMPRIDIEFEFDMVFSILEVKGKIKVSLPSDIINRSKSIDKLKTLSIRGPFRSKNSTVYLII